MSLHELIALAPLLVLAGGAVLLMLLISATRDHRATAQFATLVTILASLAAVLAPAAEQITPLMSFDAYARSVQLMVCLGGLAVTLLLYGYLEGVQEPREEMYLLLLLALLGGAVLGGARHAASLLLGLEIMTVALFGMIGYDRSRQLALEATLKYLALSAASSATLLFGLALLYAAAGSLEFGAMGAALAGLPADDRDLALAGVTLVLAGLGFKLSLVPFHIWTPDVYGGAPAPVTALLATVAKGAVLAVMLRLWLALPGELRLSSVLSVLAVLTILVGNLLALLSADVKRLLAYSSIAHFGYALVPVIIGGPFATEAVLYYLAAYFVTTLGAFGVVSQLSSPLADREADRFEDYRGLFWRRPYLTSIMVPMLLSLAGVPLTAGFIAKFYVLAAGVGVGAWILTGTVVLGSAIGLYYYLRLTIQMFLRPDGGARPPREGMISELTITGGIALGAMFGLVFWLGILPQPVLGWLQFAAG